MTYVQLLVLVGLVHLQVFGVEEGLPTLFTLQTPRWWVLWTHTLVNAHLSCGVLTHTPSAHDFIHRDLTSKFILKTDKFKLIIYEYINISGSLIKELLISIMQIAIYRKSTILNFIFHKGVKRIFYFVCTVVNLRGTFLVVTKMGFLLTKPLLKGDVLLGECFSLTNQRAASKKGDVFINQSESRKWKGRCFYQPIE